ncbi:SDR family NAD(P)-dependent oxidoreductase [[Phormidium ambiguum] IAM M-71]|uniref:SDR family NAD(P)-dependent oxidoreductase n=1 Tax=[Phormidium ambiguum] IAM M-71 TaxID=454136 RepID=UPI000A048CD6|nr:SDR family NAD(P)-dependent oxidoreductase [Phormidium ambiguum]
MAKFNSGGKAIAIPTDVTKPEACQNFIEKSMKTFGAIDGLVNNTGISMFAKVEEVTDVSIFDRYDAFSQFI